MRCVCSGLDATHTHFTTPPRRGLPPKSAPCKISSKHKQKSRLRAAAARAGHGHSRAFSRVSLDFGRGDGTVFNYRLWKCCTYEYCASITACPNQDNLEILILRLTPQSFDATNKTNLPALSHANSTKTKTLLSFANYFRATFACCGPWRTFIGPSSTSGTV